MIEYTIWITALSLYGAGWFCIGHYIGVRRKRRVF